MPKPLCKFVIVNIKDNVPFFEKCTKYSQSKGMCSKHGGKRICKIDGCNNYMQRYGVCIKHGANKQCSITDCIKNAKCRGLCSDHGGKRIYKQCTEDGCITPIVSKGFCSKHGGGTICKFDNCNKRSQVHGFCRLHDSCNKKHLEQSNSYDQLENLISMPVINRNELVEI